MSSGILIDGIAYNVGVISITRKASFRQESLGTTLDNRKHYDVKGTYYDYDVEFYTKALNVNDYDNLYEVLTSPQEYHSVVMPYGQTTTSFIAKVTTAQDRVIQNYNDIRKWRKH